MGERSIARLRLAITWLVMKLYDEARQTVVRSDPCGCPWGVRLRGVRTSVWALCSKVRGAARRGGFFSEFSIPQKVIRAHFDKYRLCKQMITVIAVILHPSRALFDSIRQSYDRNSVPAAKNSQTKTTFPAVNLFVYAFYPSRARTIFTTTSSLRPAKHNTVRRHFRLNSTYFAQSTKIEMSPKSPYKCS